MFPSGSKFRDRTRALREYPIFPDRARETIHFYEHQMNFLSNTYGSIIAAVLYK